ncbi:MAG: cobalamin B12-binding domain-containing protein [Spirochaetota bacterium]
MFKIDLIDTITTIKIGASSASDSDAAAASLLSDAEYLDYLDNLLSGRRQACVATVQRLLDEEAGVRALYLDLFQRSLYDVGALWERNKISVAVEHLATAITESLMSLVYPVLFRSERVNRRAVVACVANEYHQVGARMVADIFELNGWDTAFLGANTPQRDVVDMISRTEPHVVGLSLAVYSRVGALHETIELVRSRWADVPVIVGGQAFAWGGTAALAAYPGVTYVPSIDELEKSISGMAEDG